LTVQGLELVVVVVAAAAAQQAAAVAQSWVEGVLPWHSQQRET